MLINYNTFYCNIIIAIVDVCIGHINQMNNNQCVGTTNTGLPPVTRARPRKNSCVADDDPAIHGTEMVMLYDYKVCYIHLFLGFNLYFAQFLSKVNFFVASSPR